MNQAHKDKISASVRRHIAEHGHNCVGRAVSPETRERASRSMRATWQRGVMRGHPMQPATREKIARALTGNKNSLGVRPSPETRLRLSEAARRRGESHPFYIDGRGDERRSIRKASALQLDNRLWREAVFARDDWTCQMCGTRGGRLVADHVLSWYYHPDSRFDVANGRTLCQSCHVATPNYGTRAHERQLTLG